MWTCAKCGSKVDPSFDVCWNCGTSRDGTEDPSFVSADESGPIALDDDPSPDVMLSGPYVVDDTSELVPCYQALSLVEAKFLADQLGDRGITAVTDGQDMQDTLGGWTGNPRVYCHEVDLAKARAFLEEYEKKKADNIPLG